MGHHFGLPFHVPLQRRVLFEALTLLENARVSGTIREVPIKRADVRLEANVHLPVPGALKYLLFVSQFNRFHDGAEQSAP